MNLSNESLLAIVLVGIVAGWLAGKIVDGGGFGLIGDLIVGIDNVPVHNVADLHKRVDFAHVGDVLKLSILHEGKPATVKVPIETTRPSQRQSRQWN